MIIISDLENSNTAWHNLELEDVCFHTTQLSPSKLLRSRFYRMLEEDNWSWVLVYHDQFQQHDIAHQLAIAKIENISTHYALVIVHGNRELGKHWLG